MRATLRGTIVWGSAAVLALSATECTSFPQLARGTCGNSVIDPGEDCDGFARGAGTSCGAPGSVTACRLGCSFDPNGAVCPSGWGCGADGICREPSGKFARRPETIVAGAWRVALADFDGDHRKDVLTRAQVDARGFSKLRAHYFDGDMSLVATGFLPTKVGSPVTRDLDGDGRSDLVFTVNAVDASLTGAVIGAVGVMLGQKDRSLSPVAYPAFVFAETNALMFPITGFPGFPMRVLVFGTGPMGSALLHPDPQTGAMGFMAPLPDGPTGLAGSAVGNVIETTPCDELVWAYTGKTSASVMTACKRDALAWTWNDGGSTIDIALPAGVTVDAGVRIADIDLDGHRDVLIGASGKTYVAYGNGAGAFSTITQAFTIPVYFAQGAMPLPLPAPFPLAIGDVSGDGKPDYVMSQYVLTSIKNDPNNGYAVAFYKSPGAWTSAAIADLDANGFPDVIAGSKSDLDLDFLNGTGTFALNPFTIPTSGTTSQFAVGDVDGDLIKDLIFAESSPGAEDQLAIVFGKAGAIPDPPISIGRFGRIDEATIFNPGAALDSIGIISHSADPNDHSARIALLAGSGDRLPLAPFALSTLSLTGVPFNVVTGSFAKGANVDVVALAGDVPASTSMPFSSFRFWLAPATGPAKFQLSAPSDPLPAALHPVAGIGKTQRAAALTASGDIDGDGATDVVSAMPYTTDDTTSVLVVAKPKSDGKGGWVMNVAAQIELPFPVAIDGELALADVDGDGALDAVILGGSAAAKTLLVMWNDGAGGFAVSRSTSVNAMGEQPTDFALVRVAAATLPAIAYVTRTSLIVAQIGADRATVTRETLDATLNYGTGVAGGDIDGDGVDDIAVADTPSLVLYRGQPALK